ERDVRVYREPYPRQHPAGGQQRVPLDPHGLGEAQPGLEPALAVRPPVVIDDPLDPPAPHVGLGTVGHDGGVLDGDRLLVAEAVRHPQLQLLAPRRGSAPTLPPAPPVGRCPISRAVPASTPAVRSSPSDQKVPSNRSRSARAASRSTTASTAAAVGI